jgi:hypothetical protein
MNKIDFILKFNKNARDRGLTIRDAIALCAIAKITSEQKECTASDIFQITGDKGMGATLRSMKALVEYRTIINKDKDPQNYYKLTQLGIEAASNLLKFSVSP